MFNTVHGAPASPQRNVISCVQWIAPSSSAAPNLLACYVFNPSTGGRPQGCRAKETEMASADPAGPHDTHTHVGEQGRCIPVAW